MDEGKHTCPRLTGRTYMLPYPLTHAHTCPHLWVSHDVVVADSALDGIHGALLEQVNGHLHMVLCGYLQQARGEARRRKRGGAGETICDALHPTAGNCQGGQGGLSFRTVCGSWGIMGGSLFSGNHGLTVCGSWGIMGGSLLTGIISGEQG